jgi:glyoxylase-like metal-dependent hydrolase (beta-lactamase superfamily II)
MLRGGEMLALYDGVEVVATPGHTAGHLSYYLPRSRVLLAGDALTNVAGLKGSHEAYTEDGERANDSVRRLAALRPRAIYFGHGTPITAGAAARLDELAGSL